MRNPSTGETVCDLASTCRSQPMTAVPTSGVHLGVERSGSYGRLTTYLVDQEPLPAGRTESQLRPNQSSSSAGRSRCKITRSQAPTFCSETCRLSLSLMALCVRPFYVAIDGITETDLSSCRTRTERHLPQRCRKLLPICSLASTSTFQSAQTLRDDGHQMIRYPMMAHRPTTPQTTQPSQLLMGKSHRACLTRRACVNGVALAGRVALR